MWAQMPPGGSTPTALRVEGGSSEDEVGGHHTGGQRALVVVHVVEKQVERRQALDEARLDPLPFGDRHDPRDDVEWPGPLDPARVLVDRVGDADGADLSLGGCLAVGQSPRAEGGQVSPEGGGSRPGSTVRPEDLVEEGPRPVGRPALRLGGIGRPLLRPGRNGFRAATA